MMNQQDAPIQVSVQFYRANVVRIRKALPGTSLEAQSCVAIVAAPEAVPVQEKAGMWQQYSSEQLTVEVEKSTGSVRFLSADGTVVLTEKLEGASFPPSHYGDQGELVYTGARQAFRLDTEEAIYGLGQHQTGRLNQRQQHLLLSHINMETAIPFFISTKGYGVLWNNASPTDFWDGPSELAFHSQVGEVMDYFFFLGEGGVDDVLGAYQWVTGKPPVPPLWTMGYCQSRERYASQFELEETVRRYRELGVPLDVIIQDWRYWGDAYPEWNGLVFRKDGFFPDMKGAVDRIHAMQAKVFISIWPNFGCQTAAYQAMEKIGGLLYLENTGSSEASIYDPWKPEARELYWELLKRELVPSGVDGWWMDATEPEHNFRPVQCMWPQDDPLDRMTAAGRFRAVRNEYPLVHVESVMQHQRAERPEKRPVVLTRSAYVGQQRTGAYVWSGDVRSTWKDLRYQITAGLNFSMSGNPLWNSDIGGFFGGAEFPVGLYDPGFTELYVRWLQFGVFCPMMRSHGTYSPREIWQFGERGSWGFDAIARGIRLRYQLLPYFYAQAHRIATKGGAYLYPLALEEPTNAALRTVSDAFMVGHNLLVAPIVESYYVKDRIENWDSVQTRQVVFPTGRWYHFFTEKVVEGTDETPAPIDEVPFFVRAGTILPLGPDVQYTGEKPWDDLEVRVYPGAEGRFTLYEDAGDGLEYEQRAFTEIEFVWEEATKTLTISDRVGCYPTMLQKRQFRIRVVGVEGERVVPYTGTKTCICLG